MRRIKPYAQPGKGTDGFSFIELLMAMIIVGVLAGISIPNVLTYRKQAEFAALKADLDIFMDAQDAYFTVNNKFYPDSGRINIRSGVAYDIPELGFSFRQGHKHRYRLYGRNVSNRRRTINEFWIYVYADEDYNGNGRNDRFRYWTRIRNGQFQYQRRFQQFR